MKSTFQYYTIIRLFFLLIFIAPSASAQLTNGYTTISGTVKDKKTKKKIEYASITVPGTSIATVSNADGEFAVKVSDSLQVKEIEISHIGYSSLRYPFGKEGLENITIFLTPNPTELKDVVIHSGEPRQLVEQAILKIGDNYTEKPSLLTGFYRETVKKGRNYIDISEAVVDVYKTPYYRKTASQDGVQLLKGRSLLSPKKGDTLAVKVEGGPNLSLHLDMVKNPDILLDLETLNYYKFFLEGTEWINEKPHYVVKFQPAVVVPYALYYGTLYIDQSTLTFSRGEFHLDMKDRSKATQAILRKKPPKLKFKPEEVVYTIVYRQQDGRSHLHYINSELRFKCDWKKRFFFFSTTYTVVSEMVITDLQFQNVSNIPRKLAFKQDQSLSDKVDDFYDPDFWQDYNIIPPTESLESAIDKLRKQYK